MFYGPDGKPLRNAPKRRGASNKSANKLVKRKNGPHSDFFKSIMRQNE